MKFQPDPASIQSISRHGPGWVQVGPDKIAHSVLLGPNGLRQPWDCTRFDALTAAHFAALAALDVELVLFGSGERLRFVPPAWLAPLMQRRIGVETMDSAAACRTYNFLLAEDRRVALALLLETP
ncbi:Xcc1710-like domain-containing protein [Acidovorax sp. HDW3]|uniref:Mth938-like domain-containing protein n=1 Tax=Acidovorax sp. HDW3 TaxID=2714923 RepID=UPI00140BA5A3|nr:Mth938-like domain-containing protein [Acidovorax sp. HDW3]QIL43289.1 Xcc1710-like domain-containing protein [Acidovorax sp. HDW3]